MIKRYAKAHPLKSDHLALTLILTRGQRATLTKTRDLALLDADKLLSMNCKSLKADSQQMEALRVAVETSGLKTNSLPLLTLREHVENNGEEGGNGIFRLVRAAQRHYLTLNTRARGPNEEEIEDRVNTSFQND